MRGKAITEKAIEEQDSRAFHPPANRVRGHRICGNSHYHSQRKQEPLRPRRTRKPAKINKRSDQDKSQCRQNMRQSERCMRRKHGIKRGQLRSSRVSWMHKRNTRRNTTAIAIAMQAENPMGSHPQESCFPCTGDALAFSLSARIHENSGLRANPDQKRSVPDIVSVVLSFLVVRLF